MSTVFVGRQPIYARDLSTVAYELLFRSSDENRADFSDGEQATAELLLNTFTEIGLEKIVGNLPAFINLPESFILNEHSFALPKELVVLEVLEDVRPTEEVLAALKVLKDDGYTIAIDDFVYSTELMPLVELADIVKVDLPAIPRGELASHVELLRNHGVKILAEKVETKEEFELCKSLGFDYFQGYFFCRPTIVKGKKLPINRLALMRLIAQLQSSKSSLRDIADIIQTEPSLSLKLLRFVNSVYFGLSSKVESVRHAVTLAGIHRITTLSSLELLSKAADEKPKQFIQTVLIRARMAELLAEQLRQVRADSYFMMGLFSAVDALLDIPMEEALELIPVSKDIEDALRERKGIFGTVLNCVLAYEKGDWGNVSCQQLDGNTIRKTYLDAITWATNSVSEGLEIDEESLAGV